MNRDVIKTGLLSSLNKKDPFSLPAYLGRDIFHNILQFLEKDGKYQYFSCRHYFMLNEAHNGEFQVIVTLIQQLSIVPDGDQIFFCVH